jgi:hypothetical protein
VGKRMMDEKLPRSEVIEISKRYLAWECYPAEIIRNGITQI